MVGKKVVYIGVVAPIIIFATFWGYRHYSEVRRAKAERIYGEAMRLQRNGTARDAEKAVALFLEAAEMGNPDAQAIIGACYCNGDCVEQDYEKAVEWFRKSAEQGNGDGLTCLGYCYKNGLGVERSQEEAFALFCKSAETGFPGGMVNLAQYYYETGNFEKAEEWCRKAVGLGDRTAIETLKSWGLSTLRYTRREGGLNGGGDS